MLTRKESHVDSLLRGISEALDIPPSKYEQAVNRYESVGKYIGQGRYPGVAGESRCYCQGSFRLGTVVRPIREGKESDYDIDLVAQLPTGKENIDPGELKKMIGDRLKEDARYKRMLQDEGKRCWTIQYAEEDGIGFHLDVLPAIPEEPGVRAKLLELAVPHYIERLAIAITDKEKDSGDYQWKSSNPEGYASWFQEINRLGFEKVQLNERAIIQKKYADIYASVEDVPDFVIRTPLQRAIQLFKRHRDIFFAGHPQEKDKPISMIITTIAAKAYEINPAGTLYETVAHIVNTLRQSNYGGLIKKDAEGWYIPNPVNSEENFADKWHDNEDRKAKVFFMWLDRLERDVNQLIKHQDTKKAELILTSLFGERVANESLTVFKNTFGDIAEVVTSRPHVVIKENAPAPWRRDGI
jgi:hypothetical protein